VILERVCGPCGRHGVPGDQPPCVFCEALRPWEEIAERLLNKLDEEHRLARDHHERRRAMERYHRAVEPVIRVMVEIDSLAFGNARFRVVPELSGSK
jgi:hypothetical protein